MVNAYSPSNATTLPAHGRELLSRRERVLGSPYRLFYEDPVYFSLGRDAHLFDADGNDFLDAYNNVPAVGHSNQRVQAAVHAQLGCLNTHTRYLTDDVVTYAERLTSLFPQPLTQVIFACTGSEAVDLALRITRHVTGGLGIIITRNAYHGTTTAAAEISPSLGAGNAIPAHIALVDAPDSLREDGSESTASFLAQISAAIEDFRERGIPFAGMIVDSVLSSDGLRLSPSGFLARAAELVRAAGGLYIADEVQPGFGRTGNWWGFERHSPSLQDGPAFVPDLVVLGKPMGNGVPISAVVGSPELFDRFGSEVRYFNTFGGNPVSIAAATAVLDELAERELLQHATKVGAALRDGLESIARESRARGDHAHIADVRGAGLFLAVEYADPEERRALPDAALAIVNQMRSRRVLVSASGTYENVLKIRPPLVFDDADAARFLDAFAQSTLSIARA